MKIKKIDRIDFINILWEEGVLVGEVIMDFPRFISLCHGYGFKPDDFKFF